MTINLLHVSHRLNNFIIQTTPNQFKMIDQRVAKIGLAVILSICLILTSVYVFYKKKRTASANQDEHKVKNVSLNALNNQKNTKDKELIDDDQKPTDADLSALNNQENTKDKELIDDDQKPTDADLSALNNQENTKVEELIGWKNLEKNHSSKEFMEAMVGDKQLYESLPTLDLSQLQNWKDFIGFPSQIRFKDVSAPLTRGINGDEGYEYLIIKFKKNDFGHYSGSSDGLHVIFGKDGKISHTDVSYGAKMDYDLQGLTWDYLHTLITEKEWKKSANKYTL